MLWHLFFYFAVICFLDHTLFPSLEFFFSLVRHCFLDHTLFPPLEFFFSLVRHSRVFYFKNHPDSLSLSVSISSISLSILHSQTLPLNISSPPTDNSVLHSLLQNTFGQGCSTAHLLKTHPPPLDSLKISLLVIISKNVTWDLKNKYD